MGRRRPPPYQLDVDFTPFGLGNLFGLFHVHDWVAQDVLGYQCRRCRAWKNTRQVTRTLRRDRRKLEQRQLAAFHVTRPRPGVRMLDDPEPWLRRVGGGHRGERNQARVDADVRAREAMRAGLRDRRSREENAGPVAGLFGSRTVREAHRTTEGWVEQDHGGAGVRPGPRRRS